jgi:phage tail-like protein
MRGLIEGLHNPHPLGRSLPGVYQQYEMPMQLASVFDECLAPLLWTLDNGSAYFDPMTAPEDFVPWLASWVSLTLDETWSLAQQRTLIARATRLYRWRGTARGIREQVEVLTGVTPEIIDSGGVSSSTTPGSPLPGEPNPHVTIRLRVPDPGTIDAAHLDAVIAACKPAHVAHHLEVLPA